MAQYNVIAGCGHETTVQLYGAMRERERRLAWMRSPGGMCNACYAAHKRQQEVTEEMARIEADAQRLAANYRTLDREAQIVALSDVKDQLAQGLGSRHTRAVAQRAIELIEE